MGPRLGTPSLLEDTADKRLSYVGTFVGRVTASLSFAGSLKAGTDVRAGPGSRVSTGGGSFVVTRGISGATGSAATGSAKRTTGTGAGFG